jgi:hypothetical protein
VIGTYRFARLLLGAGLLLTLVSATPARIEGATQAETRTAAGTDPQAAFLVLGTPAYLLVADDTYIEVDFGYWLVYLPSATTGKISIGPGQGTDSTVRGYILTETGAGPLPGNNSIPWQTGTEYLEFLSSDPSVATVTSNGQLLFLRPGWVQITVKGRVSQVNQLYQIVTLPFGLGATRADVIAALGEPDLAEPVSVTNPDQKTLHGRTYQPQPGKSISVEHWQWEAYPGLVVVIDKSTGKVDAIINWGQEFMAEAFREATRIRLQL